VLAAAIGSKDREVLEARLREFAAVYDNGGLAALRHVIQQEKGDQKQVYVRLVSAWNEVALVSVPDDWVTFRDIPSGLAGYRQKIGVIRIPKNAEKDFVIASTLLPDNSLLQVGRSSNSRESVLGTVRQSFIVVGGVTILAAFAAGLFIAHRTMRPVRQIVEGEARVLGKTRSTLLAAAALIILTAALCVLSTLMGWVFDRRRDFAIMKALGASDRLLNGFFATEAAALGALGAVIGFGLGIGIAAWIGRVNFHAPVVPRFSVLPVVMAGSMIVTLLAAILPIFLLRRVQPAVILRGE